jgi:oligopeptidase B
MGPQEALAGGFGGGHGFPRNLPSGRPAVDLPRTSMSSPPVAPSAPPAPSPAPPVAKTIPTSVTLHGELRVDPYAYMRERENPDVLAYLHAENSYTTEMTRRTKSLEDELYREMLGRIK